MARAATLAALGWTPELASAFAPHEAEGLVPGRVAAQDKTLYLLYTAEGESRAAIAGRLRHEAARASDLPAVGDWVAARPSEGDGHATIVAVLPRKSAFVRKAAGRGSDEQVVAANVDTVLVVTGLDGDLNARRLERYLAVGWESGALPAIVLSKSDIEEDADETDRVVEEVALGVPVHRVSGVTGDGVEELRRYLAEGRTVALLGSSGVGKSTLVNALVGSERQRVAAVREDGKGRHTTTRRELILIPGGGILLDTPGMRELQLWEVDEGIASAFPDITEIAAGCRFADCSHGGEPGCAVEAAVASGALPADRLESLRKLQAEMRHQRTRVDRSARIARKKNDRVGAKALRARVRSKYR